MSLKNLEPERHPAPRERDLKLGLVGCGRHAERGYAPAVAAARGVRLVAAADPVRTRCERLAPPGHAYESAAALIATASVDAIALATPAAAHLGDAALAARVGLPVLVEKPPAADALETMALARLEPAPWIGFNLRFDRTLQALREKLRGPRSIELTIERAHRRGAAWSPYVIRDDALLAMGAHLIDLALWLSGSTPVRARAGVLAPERAELELELERGVAQIACAVESESRDVIEARDRSGRLIASRSSGGPLRRGARRVLAHRGRQTGVRLLALELEAFAAAARGEQPEHLARAGEGVAVMAAIDAVRRSAASGRAWESVEVAGAPI